MEGTCPFDVKRALQRGYFHSFAETAGVQTYRIPYLRAWTLHNLASTSFSLLVVTRKIQDVYTTL